MTQFLRNFRSSCEGGNRLITIIAFTVPALFLVVKSWVNTSLFLAFFICLWSGLRERRKFFVDRGARFWIILACLTAPFLAELIAQIGRGAFVFSSLDGPSRTILAAGIFVYLSTKNITNIISMLSLGSAIGILLVFISLQIYPEYYWDGRAATYFVDPITLPCYTVALLGIFLFGSWAPSIDMRVNLIIKLFLLFLTAYIAVESSSRSAWVAWIVLVEAYILYALRGSYRNQFALQLVLISSIVATFYSIDIFRERTVEAFGGLISFLTEGGGQNTSTGQRLVMLLVDIELVRLYPFFGLPDGVMPTFADLKSLVPSLTEEIYVIKTLAGSHSELSGQVVRKGILLGLFSLWGLFFYPAYLFLWKYKSWMFSWKRDECIGFGLLISVVVSALFIQVFNLKMTMSFYSLVMSLILAHFHRQLELQEENRFNIKTL